MKNMNEKFLVNMNEKFLVFLCFYIINGCF